MPVDTVAPAFGDPNVQFVNVPRTRRHESALIVRSAGGTTLALNDIVGNIRNASGFGGWLLHLAGFAGDDSQIPKAVKMAMIDDANAWRLQLERWAEVESLKRVLVSHDSVIDENPRQTLRDLAESLVKLKTMEPYARQHGVKGRSTMNKARLELALLTQAPAAG